VTAAPTLAAPFITWKVTVPWFTVDAAATVAVNMMFWALLLKATLGLSTLVVVATGVGVVFGAV
jgi:hypothetical protein